MTCPSYPGERPDSDQEFLELITLLYEGHVTCYENLKAIRTILNGS